MCSTTHPFICVCVVNTRDDGLAVDFVGETRVAQVTREHNAPSTTREHGEHIIQKKESLCVCVYGHNGAHNICAAVHVRSRPPEKMPCVYNTLMLRICVLLLHVDV